METLRVYRTILANGSLRRVLAAFLAFNTQENGVWIAIVVYAYAQGGAATAGLVAVAQLVPSAIVAPLGAVIGDRMRRDRALTLGYLIQALANGGVALALVFAPPLVVYAFAVVAACAITLTRPVHHALLPELADTPEELTAANSVSSSMEGLGMLLGPFVAAAVLVTAGPGAVLAIFACTSALGAALSLGLRLHETPVEPGEAAEPEALVGDAIGGLLELRREPGAPTLTVLGASQFFVLGALDVFYALLAIDVLAVGESGTGLLASAVGVGGLVGAASTAVLVGRRRLAPAILGGLVVMGAALAAVAGVSTFALAVVLLALCGAGRSFFDVAARTLLQRSVKDEVLARVFGVQEALIMIVLAIGSASVPILVAVFGERGAFLAAGAALPLFGLVSFSALRTADRLADVPDPGKIELLLAIPLFQPLPYRVVEQLARALAPRFVEAGHHVIREGDLGDRFYILTTGDAVVSSGGREVARLAAGDYAGEIALLRDVPRTASVVASTDVHLLSLEREEFLGAVVGHRPSVQAADEEAERRLAELQDPGEGET
jgi:MFS family permease